MSVVVGIEHKGQVWMAADSLVSDDEITFETTEPPKVFEWNGVVLGSVGSFRVGNVLFEAFEPPKIKASEDALSFMVRRFAPALRVTLEENDIDTKRKVVEDSFMLIDEWSLMVGLIVGGEGRIYIVDDDFSVSRAADGYAFIGSGGEVAAGALFAIQGSKRTPGWRIEKAVAAASKHVASVGGKIVIEHI